MTTVDRLTDKGTDRPLSAIGAEPMTDDQYAEQEARKLRAEFRGSVKISRSTYAGQFSEDVSREWWIWLAGDKATCTASGPTLSLAVAKVRREYELAMMVEQMRADVRAAEAAAPMPLPGLRHSDNQPLGSPKKRRPFVVQRADGNWDIATAPELRVGCYWWNGSEWCRWLSSTTSLCGVITDKTLAAIDIDALPEPPADAVWGEAPTPITSGPTNDATTDTLPLVKTGPGGDFTQEYHG